MGYFQPHYVHCFKRGATLPFLNNSFTSIVDKCQNNPNNLIGPAWRYPTSWNTPWVKRTAPKPIALDCPQSGSSTEPAWGTRPSCAVRLAQLPLCLPSFLGGSSALGVQLSPHQPLCSSGMRTLSQHPPSQPPSMCHLGPINCRGQGNQPVGASHSQPMEQVWESLHSQATCGQVCVTCKEGNHDG